jgi:hypothetical protein
VKAETKAADSKVEEDVWTVEQQKQMETGMKTFPASLPTKERWIKIAETVDGKSAKQCFDRFKSIVAKLKADGK